MSYQEIVEKTQKIFDRFWTPEMQKMQEISDRIAKNLAPPPPPPSIPDSPEFTEWYKKEFKRPIRKRRPFPDDIPCKEKLNEKISVYLAVVYIKLRKPRHIPTPDELWECLKNYPGLEKQRRRLSVLRNMGLVLEPPKKRKARGVPRAG